MNVFGGLYLNYFNTIKCTECSLCGHFHLFIYTTTVVFVVCKNRPFILTSLTKGPENATLLFSHHADLVCFSVILN